LKTTYTKEAIADIVEAITRLNERNPTAAANLDAEIARQALDGVDTSAPTKCCAPCGTRTRSRLVMSGGHFAMALDRDSRSL
jgi:hypothetical protein